MYQGSLKCSIFALTYLSGILDAISVWVGGYPESVSTLQQTVWVHQIGVVAISCQRARIIARGYGVSLNSETTR